MKLILVLLLQVFFSVQVFSQFTPKTKGKASVIRTLYSTTYFILTGEDNVDEALKKGAEEFWNITPIRFIEEDSLKYLIMDKNKSFVYIHEIKEKGNSKKMKALCLVNGGYNGKVAYIENCLAFISIDDDGFETKNSKFIYRLGHMIYQLQDVLNINKEESFIEKNSTVVKQKYIKYYKSKTAKLREKTLLIDEKYLSRKIVSKQEMEKAYKFNLEFVSKDVIEKAIKDKDSSKAYLVSSLNLYKINTVTDCGTGEILYAELEEKDIITRDFVKNFDRDDMLMLNTNAKSGK